MQAGILISGERTLTREQMYANASRASSGLEALGVAAGDAVAILMRNDFAFFEATYGAGRLGAYALPLNWHFGGAEVRAILDDSGARVLVVHADLLPAVRDHLPDAMNILVVETPPEILTAYGLDAACGRIPAGATAWPAWRDRHPPWRGKARTRPGALLYTSGTTGKPKGVRREPYSKAQMALGFEIGRQLYGFAPTARTVITGPMYHAGPNVYAMAMAATADRVILQPRFDAAELLSLIDRHAITSLSLVPTMLVRMLALPETVRAAFDGGSLTHVAHSAAPCPAEVKRAMIDWWGPVIVELYGGTETGPVVGCTSAEWLAHPGTVGRPFRGTEIRILDEDGRDLPSGAVGEIYARNAANSAFSYPGLENERRAIERDGLISLGDVGYLDEDGFLHLCDRKKDMVISGGVNIFPAEIEAELVMLDGVRDCAVFGVPDAEFGEALIAYVERDPEAAFDEARIRRRLAERLARYKIPRRFRLVEALPRDDTGKIFKRLLRAPYWEGRDRAI